MDPHDNTTCPAAGQDDTRLKGLLKEWQAVEPSSGFDQRVWARIRQGNEAATPRRATPGVMRLFLGEPVRAAADAVIGLAIGTGAALLIPAAASDSPPVRLLQRDTLAGSYLALATGGSR